MGTPQVGDRMIDVMLKNIDGREHRLSEYLDKYILIDFWSMTCFPCMNAARELKVINEDYGNLLNIVGVNMDTERSMWVQGTNRDGIVWHNLSDGMGAGGGIGLLYGIFAFPAYMLISPEGIVMDKWMGFKEGRFKEKLKQHLKLE